MKKILLVMFLMIPAISQAALITHKLEVDLEGANGNVLKTASIAIDADPDAWTLGQAWIHIDGMTVASDQTEQLGKDQWTYREFIGAWESYPMSFSFQEGDWRFILEDALFPEYPGQPDDNPMYAFPDGYVIWTWSLSEPGRDRIGGSVNVSSHSWAYKVPEPHTFALFALGLAALGMRRRVI